MFERFTDRARAALVHAQSESAENRHGFIGTEHLLLGLLRLGDGMAHQVLTEAGVAIEPLREKVGTRLTEWVDPRRNEVTGDQALAAIGIDLAAVKSRIEEAFGEGALPDPMERPPFTPKAKESLEYALRHALMLRHRYIGTEHLLLGVLEQKDGLAVQALADLGVDAEDVATRVRALAAPLEKRVNDAWEAITELRREVDVAAPDVRERMKDALGDLGRAHAQAIREEQEALGAIAGATADALEAAVAAARRALEQASR